MPHDYVFGYEKNMVFSLVKFLHEVFHIFTPHILEYEFRCRTKYDETVDIPYNSAPTKLGLKLCESNQSPIGDMGFLFEQILFGSNLRMYIQTVNWDLYECECYFEQLQWTVIHHDGAETLLTSILPTNINVEENAIGGELGVKRDVEGNTVKESEEMTIRRSARQTRQESTLNYSFKFFNITDTTVMVNMFNAMMDMIDKKDSLSKFINAVHLPVTALIPSQSKKQRRSSKLTLHCLKRKNASLEMACIDSLEEPESSPINYPFDLEIVSESGTVMAPKHDHRKF